VHGAAWSDLGKVEKSYPGLEATFSLLKQRKRLKQRDIAPLIKFIQHNITCTTKVDKIRQFGLSKRKARKVAKSVLEVNVHHHTKTCRKYNTDCRFCFPRLPSNHFIIAQEIEKDDNDEERNALMHAVREFLSMVKEVLPDKIEEEEDSGNVKFNFEAILREAVPTISINEDEGTNYIVVISGKKKFSFKLT
jgi:hypothetical protein